MFYAHFFMNNIINTIINSLRFLYHHPHYCYYYYQHNLHILVHLLIYFVLECQQTCFNNSWYTFSKWGRQWWWNKKACKYQGGYLVSIESEEEWQFINHEIQNRSSWNTSAWHIGLRKMTKNWTWESGARLNIWKWRDSITKNRRPLAEISKNGSLFNSIFWNDSNAFICEMPGGK